MNKNHVPTSGETPGFIFRKTINLQWNTRFQFETPVYGYTYTPDFSSHVLNTPVFMKVTFSSTLDYSMQNTRFQFKTPVFRNTQCHVHTFWQNTRFGVHTFSCTPVIVKHRLSIWYTRLNTHLISINTFLKTPDVTFTRFDKTHVLTKHTFLTHVFKLKHTFSW